MRGTLKISRNKHPTDEVEAVNGVPLRFFFLQHVSLETTVMMLVIRPTGWILPASVGVVEAFEELYVTPLKFVEEIEFLF